MSRPARSGPGLAVAAAVALLVLPGETTIWLLFDRGRLGGVAALALHAVVTGCVAAAAWLVHRRGWDPRALLLMAVTVIVAGPFAAAGTLLAALLAPGYFRSAQPIEEWFELIFPEDGPSCVRRMTIVEGQALTKPEETDGDPTPLIDVLRFGSLEEKRAVLSWITKQFQPAFGAAMREALRDPVNAIRVQASAGAAAVEVQYARRCNQLTRTLEISPDDVDHIRALARHHDDHAFAGLGDAARLQESRERAEALYRRLLRLQPRDGEACVAIGRLLVRQGACHDAMRWFRDAVAAGMCSTGVIVWFMEALYRLGLYDELHDLATEHLRHVPWSVRLPVDVRGAAWLWSAGHPAAAGARR